MNKLLAINTTDLWKGGRVAHVIVTSLKNGRSPVQEAATEDVNPSQSRERKDDNLHNDSAYQRFLALYRANYVDPLRNGLAVCQVIGGLVKRGKTVDSFHDDTKVRFTSKELEQITTKRGGGALNRDIVNNPFANQVVQLLARKDNFVLGLYKTVQIRALGLQATIRGNKPALIDLEPLSIFYCGPVKDLQVTNVCDYTNGNKLYFPKDIPQGQVLTIGSTEFIPSEDQKTFKVNAKILFSEDSAELVDRDKTTKSVEVDKLELKGDETGKKLEVSPLFKQTDGQMSLALPLYIKSLDQIQVINLNLKFKKR